MHFTVHGFWVVWQLLHIMALYYFVPYKICPEFVTYWRYYAPRSSFRLFRSPPASKKSAAKILVLNVSRNIARRKCAYFFFFFSEEQRKKLVVVDALVSSVHGLENDLQWKKILF